MTELSIGRTTALLSTLQEFFNQKKPKRWLSKTGKSLNRSLYHTLALPLSWLPGGTSQAMCLLAEKMEFSPELMILAYCQGIFPVGTDRGKIQWENPPSRAIILLDQFRVPPRMRTYVRKGQFEITYNTDFEATLTGCMQRSGNWIIPRIVDIYRELHRMGVAHSAEAWQDGRLVGGLIGIAIGGLYSVESMFCRVSNASKVALVQLCERLQAEGFILLDVQYLANHFVQCGAIEISREEYRKLLAQALIIGKRLPL